VVITSARAASAEEWDTAWANCVYGTYFHSRAWAELWSAHSNGTYMPAAKLIRFSDGYSAVITASESGGRIGPARRILSPAGTYGGWVSADELSPAHSELLTTYILRTFSDLWWRVNPYAHPAHLRANHLVEDFTQVLDLQHGYEAVVRGMSGNHRRAISLARRSGVEVRLAETQEDWLAYYAVYEDSLERWGGSATSNYSWDLFERLQRSASPAIRLWLACVEDVVAAGALCFYATKHVAYWHGASRESFFSKKPIFLLMESAIEDACARGFGWFDFNPSGGHKGVSDFKRRFGTEHLPAPVVTSHSRVNAALQPLRTLKHSVRGALR
jgi:Acetyltransferase (GNAT) domain